MKSIEAFNTLEYLAGDHIWADIDMIGQVDDHFVRCDARFHILILALHDNHDELADHQVQVKGAQMWG